ncbi:hypothetical protein [Streptomyces sp. NPDC059209]|uniref:HalD/BesD family halogenase n=1 Tax=Streptomyces sp. NPDC059209 TaxID=3346769 RepID=UPI0036D15BEF
MSLLIAPCTADGTCAARDHADGYLPLPGLLTPEGLGTLREEARRLEKTARRRDFAMTCMDGSPRHMTTLGGETIARQSGLIPQLYTDAALLDLVGALTVSGPSPSPISSNAMSSTS